MAKRKTSKKRAKATKKKAARPKSGPRATKKQAAGEKTPGKHRGGTRNLRPAWGPGQSGNPAGRPKGSRNRVAEEFLADLYEAWQEHGKDALDRVAKARPQDLIRVVASVIPKQFEVGGLDDLRNASAEKIEARLRDEARRRFQSARPGLKGKALDAQVNEIVTLLLMSVDDTEVGAKGRTH